MQRRLNYFLWRITDPNWIFRHLVVFGAVSCFRVGVKSLRLSLQCQANLAQRYGKGKYALVLGCSRSFGKEFALDLARSGFQVVLVGEDISELKEISDIVMAESQALVGVKGVVWASRDGAKQLIELIEEVVVVFVIIVQLGEVDISILVNGLAQGQNGNCEQLCLEMNAQVQLMKYVVARMKGRRDRSLIVNVARKEENILAKGVTNSLVHAMMESVYLEIKDSKRFKVDIVSVRLGRWGEKFAVRQAWQSAGRRFEPETLFWGL